MEKNLKNIAGALVDYLAIRLKLGVNRIEKKVDHYKLLRDLESDFMQFGIQCFEHYHKKNEIPSELKQFHLNLENRIKEFEAT